MLILAIEVKVHNFDFILSCHRQAYRRTTTFFPEWVALILFIVVLLQTADCRLH